MVNRFGCYTLGDRVLLLNAMLFMYLMCCEICLKN